MPEISLLSKQFNAILETPALVCRRVAMGEFAVDQFQSGNSCF
jgi:hypothetical protein